MGAWAGGSEEIRGQDPVDKELLASMTPIHNILTGTTSVSFEAKFPLKKIAFLGVLPGDQDPRHNSQILQRVNKLSGNTHGCPLFIVPASIIRPPL